MAYTTIDDPSAHFQTEIYAGSGSDDKVVTNSGNSDLQPDWIWIKKRSATGQHVLSDTNRGILKVLNSNSDAAEDSNSEGEMVKSVQSDGFTLGDSQAGQGDTNYTSGGTYVAWQWKANGGTTSTNTAGTNIDTTVQANTTAGFSLITYTGTGTNNDSIGHGLGAVPHWITVKNRDETNRWTVYHHKNTSSPETEYLNLQDTTATTDVATRWNDTAPTSTVITLGDNDGVSKANTKYVCYAFTEIQGYSKFGSYTGNGSEDGTFGYTGFKPAFVITKRTDTAKNWYMFDNKRTPFNVIANLIAPNLSSAEDSGTGTYIDFLSNGFKLRQDFSHMNASGGTHIYMAFAEHPFVSSEGVPTTAR